MGAPIPVNRFREPLRTVLSFCFRLQADWSVGLGEAPVDLMCVFWLYVRVLKRKGKKFGL